MNTHLKKSGKKIAMLSVSDFHSACFAAEVGFELLLVGDSLGMVVYGDPDTRGVTVDEMIRHGEAVVRGVKSVRDNSGCFVVVDMPFGSCDNPELALENARRIVRETGCAAVKVEGEAEVVKFLVANGIAVMGHVGLKPQTAERFCVKGREEGEEEEIKKEAGALEEAGVFSLVLECVPERLAAEITSSISVPTIGIGAGVNCDGQILVAHDLLGIYQRKLPKFVRQFGRLGEEMKAAFSLFKEQVEAENFPSIEESY